MCGPAMTDLATGDKIAPESLKKIRLKFYGTDMPNSTPAKTITVEIIDM